MKNTTQEELNHRELHFGLDKEKKLFLFFFSLLFALSLYLSPKTKFDEEFSKTVAMASEGR